MSAKDLRSCKILFPEAGPGPRGIMLVGACGSVGFGKLRQILQRLAQWEIDDLPVVALDPKPEICAVKQRLRPLLLRAAHTRAVDQVLAKMTILQSTPGDLPAGPAPALVIESVPEDLAIKQAVYRELAVFSPAPCLMSTTSAFTTDRLFAGHPHASRCGVLHPFFPHHKNDVWELVTRDSCTSEATLEEVRQIMRALDYHLVDVGDIPAFAADRIFCGLMLECVRLHHEMAYPAAWIDAVCQEELGCTPFAVHNMIPGSNALSAHCMQLCHQHLASSMFEPRPAWIPYCQDPSLQWPITEEPVPSTVRVVVARRVRGVLYSICAFLLANEIVSAQDLDALCTKALGFAVRPCAQIREIGPVRAVGAAQEYLDERAITLASRVAPLHALSRLA